MTRPKASIRRAMRQRPQQIHGFLITWDVNSRDHAACSRLRRFVFGYTLRNDGKEYTYPGFLERAGVQYIGQSVLFVTHARLSEIRRFLDVQGIPHHETRASLY